MKAFITEAGTNNNNPLVTKNVPCNTTYYGNPAKASGDKNA
jgi:acetyltransferase-like isoleucine patch superfamily enzyme